MAHEHLRDVAPLECIGCPVEKDEGHGRLVDDKRQDQAGAARDDLKKSRRGRIRRTNRAHRYRLAFDDCLRHRHGRVDRDVRRHIGRREPVVAIDAQLASVPLIPLIDEQHGDAQILRRCAVRERVEDAPQRRRLIEAPDRRQDSRDCVGHCSIVDWLLAIGYCIELLAICYWAGRQSIANIPITNAITNNQ